MSKGRRILPALLTGALVAGCATAPAEKTADEYGVFYEGQSEATYGTAFPVGSPQEAYRNGDSAGQTGDYDRALFEYIRGLRLAKAPDAEVLYKIGSIHHSRKNYRLADLAYRWILELEPGHPGAGTGLGLAHLQRRQYVAAEARLTDVVTGSAQPPWQAYNALGILADMEGDPVKAEAHYQRALSVNPDSPLILNNLGYSRYLVGDWQGANAALQAALRVNGSYELAWRNLALVHARQKNYRLALEALGRTGDEAEAYNDVGFVSMMEGDYSQALAFFDKAMRLSPAYYLRASENATNTRRMMDRGTGGGDH